MKTAVLLVNLGTPDYPDKKNVGEYLSQFLNDPRVIDIPWLSRKLLVNLFIVPLRSRSSSALYKKIWTEKGSPLMFHSVEAAKKLQISLGDNYIVELAMRYRKPSIESALMKLQKACPSRIIVFPVFPQYASASTGSVHEEVMRIVSKWEVIPSINLISTFIDEPSFIDAWAARGMEYMNEKYDHYLFSFHGLPERQMRKAYPDGPCLADKNCCDVLNEKNYYCYRAQCYKTARDITSKMQISNYSVSFQSRLGKSPWIKPYTDEMLKVLADKGHKKILVFAPAFVSDCLETIYEISVEYQEKFEAYGGEKVVLVESLNTHEAWIESMDKIIRKN
jgi:ferrochelatase